jgi:hypothetical protein
MTIYFGLAGVMGLALAGLVVYARFFGKPRAGVSTKTEKETGSSPSEGLVELIDIVDEGYFLTQTGSLAAIFYLQPVLSTTSTSTDSLQASFISIMHALEPKTTLQIVQLPLPSKLGDLTDRYAQTCYRWRKRVEQAQAQGDERATAAASTRYFAAAQIGSQILQTGGRAPRRETFLVLSTSAGFSGRATPVGIQKAARTLKMDAQRLEALFESNGMPLTGLTAEQALPVLWHAYNPDQGSPEMLEREAERFASIMQDGQAGPGASTLSQEEIERALADPQQELRRILAPPLVEECQAGLRFGEKEILLYFINDFHTTVPSMRRLLGPGAKFAHQLILSYYITAPPPDEMARLTRKASTAKQALQAVAQRIGALPSYKQAEEVRSIEQARAGAETEKDVPRLLGLYLGLVTSGESREAERVEFESVLRSAGVEYIPAQWMALDVWRTLLPLGQRFHRFEERNLFSHNLAPLNPATATAWFEAGGEFCGFVAYGENAGTPVVIRRERGGEFIPSDALVGAQNSGKSFTIKLWITDWIARGQRAFVVDPKLEFAALTRALGGDLLALRGGRGFNLLQFDRLPGTPASDLGPAIAGLIFEDNLAALEALYTLAKGARSHTSGVERNLLINALKRAMSIKGLDPKDAATWEPNKVFLSDVYEVLKGELAGHDPETVRLMAAVLEQYGAQDGQYYEQYNTPNDFSLDADLITATFGLGQLSSDETAKAISGHFAMRIGVNHAVRSFLLYKEPAPFHIVIDEASQLLTTPALVSSVVSMISLLSAYGISVHLAFQTMEAIQRADGLGAAENASSMNTLSGVIPAYWLFHQEPQSAETAVRLLHLQSAEARRIVANRVGQCILAFPKAGMNIPLAVIVPEAFHPLFRTDPASTRALIEGALAQPAAEGGTA